ncbi:hypothetical protein GWI33_001129 [Rhynchophorus ferrugineus]|uniref:Uncharacterized protein n=1 Tax=Rhynchophorus ferrugineus TaxID=354439 RepID=A0A834HM52_RHYFE|nr:hypothetical protein GWI33_001129 [Rhynchophorus ferrugineus]
MSPVNDGALKIENQPDQNANQARSKLNLDGLRGKTGEDRTADDNGFKKATSVYSSPTITCSPSPCIFSEDFNGCLRGRYIFRIFLRLKYRQICEFLENLQLNREFC